jgi:hypothetical protein
MKIESIKRVNKKWDNYPLPIKPPKSRHVDSDNVERNQKNNKK